MKFASAISTSGDAAQAVREAIAAARDELGPRHAHLVLLFATPHFEDDFVLFSEELASAFGGALCMGCTAEGVIGEGREIERTCCLSLLVGHLPGVRLRPFHVRQAALEEALDEPAQSELFGGRDPEARGVILFGDPFSIHIRQLLDALGTAMRRCPVVGGMASGAEGPGQNVLMLNEQLYRDGAVGVVLAGDVRFSCIVSQGCRPIGQPFVITRGEQNIIHELGGKPALERLRETFSALSPDDRKLAETALFLGMAINEYQDRFGRGDYLIRNLIGLDPKRGALAVGDIVRVGTTVQFHVRDAASADEDLRALLQPHAATGRVPAGILLFDCNGRGTRMWEQADHDVACISDSLGGVPTGGFFCAGEFGPVGGRNFIHGHTASVALLSPITPDAVD